MSNADSPLGDVDVLMGVIKNSVGEAVLRGIRIGQVVRYCEGQSFGYILAALQDDLSDVEMLRVKAKLFDVLSAVNYVAIDDADRGHLFAGAPGNPKP